MLSPSSFRTMQVTLMEEICESLEVGRWVVYSRKKCEEVFVGEVFADHNICFCANIKSINQNDCDFMPTSIEKEWNGICE